MSANLFFYRARIVASAALAGAAVSGITLRGVLPFDPHILGAIIGGTIAALNWSRISRA